LQVDFIVADVSASGASTVKPRVLKILNQRGASVTDVRNVLREFAGNYGDTSRGGASGSKASTTEEDDENEAVRERERQYLLQLVDKF
jgi:molybdopterin-guanine dinucleotide biosynthesis protein